jgi:hypothetical protein
MPWWDGALIYKGQVMAHDRCRISYDAALRVLDAPLGML